MNTTQQRIAEIEQRHAKATPGEWDFDCHSDTIEWYVFVDEADVGVADMLKCNDAKFIAHAHEDIPWLLGQLKARHEAIEQHREEVQRDCVTACAVDMATLRAKLDSAIGIGLDLRAENTRLKAELEKLQQKAP